MNSMSMQADSMKNQMAMTNAMKSGVDVMQTVNASMDPLEVQQLGAEFAVEQQRSEMTAEMFDDVMDSMWEDDETEADDEVNKIMDELAHSQLEAAKGTSGLRTAEQMQPVAAAPQQQGMMMADGDDMDDDLSARLAALRK
eukprot:TRINITY_DN360_c0_g1_i1.p3 TRINITY_DN360_c0_g1~~TRINITY_DN360_c0_g1_i1.p3  ORF type:complete len:141 (-),score=81.23 TRINITY_DN360_c0_g1_i1:419-841(-)